MGNCVSFQISCDQTLNHIFRCLCGEGYIRTLEKYLKALKREMVYLNALRKDVEDQVWLEEFRHRQRLEVVKVWLTDVENLDNEFKIVLSDSQSELQNLCLCGLCSKNVYSSYCYGKKVFQLFKEAEQLKSSASKFAVVAKPRSEIEERAEVHPTFGLDEMLGKAWNRLMEDEVRIMGLHGMNGVGKTTLFSKIHNKFNKLTNRFNFVIWIDVVSQGAQISKLQEDIAEKLQLCDEDWKNKNESDKATAIGNVLKGKRFVLMLDDIWEKVDLKAIGVPIPTRENGCKVAFTTRSRDVCGKMEDHEPVKIKCLEPDKAWKFFNYKVGDYTLKRDPVFVELAKEVADKCHGLPLALSVIGEAMTSKTTVKEWKHTIDVLTTSAAEFSDIGDKIHRVLKYSYDRLADKHKPCSLYCALVPDNFLIDKEKLIDYWTCEGFIKDDHVIKRARKEGYDILGPLIRANLLAKIGTRKVVTDDMGREMAQWIASDFGEQKEIFVMRVGVRLHEIPKVQDWGTVRKISLMANVFEEITSKSKCSELTTLFLQKNKSLKNLSSEFIRSMQNLVVLDLSENKSFNELSEQISELASLQYLDLADTSIEQLPVGFQELKKLTQLNLSGTSRLCSISGISKLSSLRILRLLDSNVHGDVSLVKELQLMEDLQVLTITVSTEMGLEQILGDQRLVNCITGLQILDFQLKPFDISLLVSMKNLSELNLRKLRVECSHVSEISTNMKCRESETDSSYLHNQTNSCFTNLSSVSIYECSGMKDLTWLLFAPNLVILEIKDSREVEEIIKEEKATNLTGITLFQKLESLRLCNLPKLESIYWSPLPFPFLRSIYAEHCPKLRKLPLNATSVPLVEEFEIVIQPREQKTDLEWEDEHTKYRFLPSFLQ